jgi:hypothetical protein
VLQGVENDVYNPASMRKGPKESGCIMFPPFYRCASTCDPAGSGEREGGAGWKWKGIVRVEQKEERSKSVKANTANTRRRVID